MKPELKQQATPTANGTQTWNYSSVVGDQTGLFLFGTEATANGSTTAAAKLFLGATDRVNNLAQASGTLDAAAASGALSHNIASSVNCLLRTTSGGTEQVKAALSATSSSGLTLNYSATDGGAYLFNGLSLAGSDHVTAVSNVAFASTDTSKVVNHGAGGVPDIVIVLWSPGSSGTDVGSLPQVTSIGIWDGTTSASATMKDSTSVSPTNLAARVNSAIGGGEMGRQIDTSNTETAIFSIGTIGSTSFTLSRTATGGIALFAVCYSIRHTSGTWAAKTGVITLPSSGSASVSVVSSQAATPQVMFLIPTRLTVTTLVGNDDSAGSFGLGIACNNNGTVQQAACAMTEKNGVATTVAKCYTSNTLALLRLDNTGTPVNSATASFPVGGASLTPSTSWSNADKVLFLTFGIASGVEGFVPQPGPSLNSPSNLNQFAGVGRISAPPPIMPAALNGLSLSMSVAYGPSVPPPSIGFVPQPGPGGAGPFNNNQFLSSIGDTSAPSASVGVLSGVASSVSVVYGSLLGAGALAGISASQSVMFGPGSVLATGPISGLAISSSFAYAPATGSGVLNGVAVSMSLAYMALPPTPITPAIVPNLIGVEDQIAIASLQSLGFVVTLLIASSNTIPEDFVMFQNPVPGPFPQGGNVTITISSGTEQFAGIGGSRWGAVGGGSASAASPEPVLETMSKAKRQANYQIPPQAGSVSKELSDAELSGQTPDDLLPDGGSKSG